jgi:hypothetical protein
MIGLRSRTFSRRLAATVVEEKAGIETPKLDLEDGRK